MYQSLPTETIFHVFRVLVLSDGEIKELDAPNSLLKNTESVFYGMVQDAGTVWVTVCALFLYKISVLPGNILSFWTKYNCKAALSLLWIPSPITNYRHDYITDGLYIESRPIYFSWWHHEKKILSVFLNLCEGNPPVTGVIASQWVTFYLVLTWISGWTKSRYAIEFRLPVTSL